MAGSKKPRVAVLGGGPAGAVVALCLAEAGVEVQLYDTKAGPTAKLGETLPPTLRPLLNRLGLTATCDAPPHRLSHGNRSYWGAETHQEKEFLFGAAGAGWHLDREDFEAALSKAAIRAGVCWHWDHHATDARWTQGRWHLEVEGPASPICVETDLVIDATGRAASFARGAGASRRYYDRLIGAAVTFQGAPGVGDSADAFTLVEAVCDGWWYSAPLSNDRMVAVYLTDGDLTCSRELRTVDGWKAMLSQAKQSSERLSPWLAGIPGEAPPVQIVPAGSARLLKLWGEGWLAVGDAACSFDPLSSNGIGSAMTSGYYAACAAAEHLQGKTEALAAYGDLVGSLFDDYLTLLHEHYAGEQRWPRSKFWSRRQVPAQSLAQPSALDSG